MKEAVFDFEVIHHHLAVLRGDARSGTLYERGADGTHSVVKQEKSHTWNIGDGDCSACGVTMIEVDDNLASKTCSGRYPIVAEQMSVMTRRGVTYEYWRHPDGSRYEYRQGGDLASLNSFRQWKVNGIGKRQQDAPDKIVAFLKALNDYMYGLSRQQSLSHSAYNQLGLGVSTAAQIQA